MRVSQGERVCPPLLPPPPWRIEGWEAPCAAGGKVGVGMQLSKAILCSEKSGLSAPHPASPGPPNPHLGPLHPGCHTNFLVRLADLL